MWSCESAATRLTNPNPSPFGILKKSRINSYVCPPEPTRAIAVFLSRKMDRVRPSPLYASSCLPSYHAGADRVIASAASQRAKSNKLMTVCAWMPSRCRLACKRSGLRVALSPRTDPQGPASGYSVTLAVANASETEQIDLGRTPERARCAFVCVAVFLLRLRDRRVNHAEPHDVAANVARPIR